MKKDICQFVTRHLQSQVYLFKGLGGWAAISQPTQDGVRRNGYAPRSSAPSQHMFDQAQSEEQGEEARERGSGAAH